MRSILTCSTHTSGLYFQDLSFLKSWKCSRERGQQCWVLKLCLSWDSWEGSLWQVWVSPAACGFPGVHPGPFLHQLHVFYLPPSPFQHQLWCWWMSLDSTEVVGDCKTPVAMLCVCSCFSERAVEIGREGACCLQGKVGSVWLCLFSDWAFLLIWERRWNPDASPGLYSWLKDFNVIKHFGKARCVQQCSSVIYLGIPEKPGLIFFSVLI